jgi:hypothetical protein
MNPLGMPLDTDVGVLTDRLPSRSRDYPFAFFHLGPISSSLRNFGGTLFNWGKDCRELTRTVSGSCLIQLQRNHLDTSFRAEQDKYAGMLRADTA